MPSSPLWLYIPLSRYTYVFIRSSAFHKLLEQSSFPKIYNYIANLYEIKSFSIFFLEARRNYRFFFISKFLSLIRCHKCRIRIVSYFKYTHIFIVTIILSYLFICSKDGFLSEKEIYNGMEYFFICITELLLFSLAFDIIIKYENKRERED